MICAAAWPTTGVSLGYTNAKVTEFSQLLAEFLSILTEVDNCQSVMKAVNEWRDEVVYGAETNKTAPESPQFVNPTAPTINGGYFAQLKRWRGSIMSNPDYTQAIGEALGFVGQEKPGRTPAATTPNFTVKPEMNYSFALKGSMQGFTAARVQYKPKNGDWTDVGFIQSSGGMININPITQGVPQSGHVRVIFVEKNQNYGNFSPDYPVTLS